MSAPIIAPMLPVGFIVSNGVLVGAPNILPTVAIICFCTLYAWPPPSQANETGYDRLPFGVDTWYVHSVPVESLWGAALNGPIAASTSARGTRSHAFAGCGLGAGTMATAFAPSYSSGWPKRPIAMVAIATASFFCPLAPVTST